MNGSRFLGLLIGFGMMTRGASASGKTGAYLILFGAVIAILPLAAPYLRRGLGILNKSGKE